MPKPLPDLSSGVLELEPFARIRLVVVDLDGTFLFPSSSSVLPILQREQRAFFHSRYGCLFTIATGRAVNSVRNLIKDLAIQRGMPLVLYNGAVVVEYPSFEIIRKIDLEMEEIGAVLAVCERHPVAVYAYRYDGPLQSDFGHGSIESVFGWSHAPHAIYDFNGLQVQWQKSFELGLLSGFSTMVIEMLGDSPPDALKQQLEQNCKVLCSRSSNRYLEIRPPNCSKGTSLAAVTAVLGITLEQTLAIGDNDNDAEMLASAGIGVAIRGASAPALQASDFVCQRGAVDGALEVLRLVTKAHRFFPPTNLLPVPSSRP